MVSDRCPLGYLFELVNYEKKSADDNKSMKNYPVCTEVILVKYGFQFQPKSEALDMLMKANTNFYIKYGSPQDAAKKLEELRK